MKNLVVGMFVFLAGCAAFAELLPGTSNEADVIAKFGQPASTRALSDGSKVLEFPREPVGMQNWHVTLESTGRVRSVEQVVDEPTFAKILPRMTRAEVLLALGRPSEEHAYQNLQENVVSWRYMDFGGRIMLFNAHFDSAGLLKYTSRTPEPTTEPRK